MMSEHDPAATPDSTAIVLGAGGPLGWVYHLGVLEGIGDVMGWNPADAGRVVGTSAGGAVAGSVLAGASTDEVLAAIIEPMSPEQREAMRAAVGSVRKSPLQRFRPQAPSLARRFDVIGLTGLLPTGVFPTGPLRRFPVGGLVAGYPRSDPSAGPAIVVAARAQTIATLDQRPVTRPLRPPCARWASTSDPTGLRDSASSERKTAQSSNGDGNR